MHLEKITAAEATNLQVAEENAATAEVQGDPRIGEDNAVNTNSHAILQEALTVMRGTGSYATKKDSLMLLIRKQNDVLKELGRSRKDVKDSLDLPSLEVVLLTTSNLDLKATEI
ncbi:OLC1v1024206C1 [Oldenlandia corymbosa var. corymbosa]|uniref:OLC1v1024206C1 n=1 Tax=Oldenlandia corymbosa var. corymbosa TaxID=529605 RepID=A0AAV1C204_OLDCO|nr:OLC1v1024206C1 [Oldenlandia corymbosa var. corymbosa]